MITLETLAPVAATGMFNVAWLMIAVPAVSAAVLLLFGSILDRIGHWIAVAAVLFSFSIAACLFAQQLLSAPDQRAVGVVRFDWITIGSWKITAGLLVDQLSILFALLITGVGSLIHIYSVGYMAHDERKRRFFAYLNLFIAAMLILVLADNYLVLFVGWEGVGLASYLLIGFWQHKPSAAAAAKKAFVMNRVGDLGMTMAVMSMLALFGSSAFVDVNERAGQLDPFWATTIGLLLLLGACGKSAQVPLQAWLLDAMEGPTPVSALIHAATMVTAGVYLVVRSHAIFEMSAAAIHGRRGRRVRDPARRCLDRYQQGRHQEGAGRLDHEPDRLHDAGCRPRPGRLRLRDLPPAHPRLLQGQHVPRRRLGDARHGRRREHAPLRCARTT